MFQWDKSIMTLDITVDQVVHLFRSMRDVQLALPGLPAQEASAYLCQYRMTQGVGTTAAFHLHKSGQLAFYINAPHEVPVDKAEAVLDQALVFVESMGFLLTDLDIHLLSVADRELLWGSLPLQKGVQPAEKPAPKPVAAEPEKPRAKPAASPSAAAAPPSAAKLPPQQAPPAVSAAPPVAPEIVAAADEVAPASPAAGESEPANVDDLLAAVEELRNRRTGVRARKKAPSPEELNRRRQELRENIGRILVSL